MGPEITFFGGIKKICVISQPTFLPWIGWFDLADQADVMIILDDVSFSKQSWQQRNRLRTANGLQFLTVPVKTSGRLGQKLLDCQLADQPFVGKMLKTIQANYSRAPFFAQTINELAMVMETAAETHSLVELNTALIYWMAGKLVVKTPMIRASTLSVGGQRGEHVAALCEHIGADNYLSPAGAADYLLEDKESFERRGIMVCLHEYVHPEYRQRYAPFMPYVSTLDLIFNMGNEASDIMRSGRRPSVALIGDINKHKGAL